MLITKKKERSHSIGGASTGEVIIHGEAEKRFTKCVKGERTLLILLMYLVYTRTAPTHTHIFIYI